MITIYAPGAQDFSTLGFGTLEPTTCTIEERAGGLYELVLRQPITEDNRAFLLSPNRIIKASAPVRETPAVTIGNVGTNTVVRDIWRVKTNGGRLHLRSKPNGHIIGAYPPGTEVVKYGESSVSGWWGVIVCDGGAKGYMYSQYLEHVGERSETISGDAPGDVIRPRQTREQLFRIYSVTNDSFGRFVEARAQHISYDLGSAIVTGTYKPEAVPVSAVCAELMSKADHDPGINIICGVSGSITGDYTGKNLLECLLEPETGIAAQTGAKVIRDNFDIFLIADEPRTRDIEIRYGKNLLTASLMQDGSGVITRIYPVGRNADGEDLVGVPVDSLHINDYPVIRSAWIEYDVAVGKDMTETQALQKLQELAEADFAAGCDLITAKLDADFVRLELAHQYAALANQYALHMYDSVPVIDRGAGINATVRMVGYTYDVLLDRYTQTTLGDMSEIETTVYGYELANGSVGGSKIANNSVGGGKLRDLSVGYAKISTAAIGQLSADAVVAIRADIRQLVAGQITTDQLYADLAAIALAQITTANINKANIEWAQIANLSAQIAEVVYAEIDKAEIEAANIKNLDAVVATIVKAQISLAEIDGAQIKSASIDSAKIALGAITTALIAQGAVGTAQIADGSITSAKVVNLNADVITAGTLSVERLLLKGANGLFRAINATDSGLTVQQLSKAEYQNAISGTVLVARSVTADKIAAKAITANEIASGTITAAEINVSNLFAADAVITAIDNIVLRTEMIEALKGSLNVWAQEKIDVAVGDVQIGGTNLLRESGWYTDVADTSVGWLYTRVAFIERPYDTYPGSDDFGDNGYIHWTGEKTGDLNTPKVSTRAGEIYTVSFRHRGAGLTLYIVGLNAAGTQTWGPSESYGNPATTDCAYTFTIPSDRDVSSIYAVFRSTLGQSGVLGRIKLERGNKATSWSPHPMDNARGVVNGSAIRITPEGIYTETPEIAINVKGTKGDLSISERGLACDYISSPSVRARYQGPGVITVGQYQVEPNGESVFATLGDALAKLTDKELPYPVSINFASDTYEPSTRLENVSGQPVVINGNNCVHNGAIVIKNVDSEVTLNNLVVQVNSAAHAVMLRHCKDVELMECAVRAGYPTHAGQNGIYALSTNIGLVRCVLSNIYHAIWLSDNASAYINACTGNNNVYSIVMRNHAQAGVLTSRPPGSISKDVTCTLTNEPSAADSGTVAQPENVQSVILTATNTRTHDGGGWYSGTNVLSQGVRSGTTFRGFLWFDLSSISGKTIKSAAISLYRRAGVGSGNPVKVLVGAHNASGPSGSTNLINGYNNYVVGYVDQKETLKASVSTGAVQHLANGTAKGLYIHSNASGYAQFDGYDGNAPQLYVTYV